MPSMYDRLVQLERLVMPIADKLKASPDIDLNDMTLPAESSNMDTSIEGPSDRGSMRASASEFQYVDSNHWTAILENIADLKDHFDNEERLRLAASTGLTQGATWNADNLDIDVNRHSLLLYGGYRPTSQAEILAALPHRGAVDRYISRYFNRQELVSCKGPPLAKT